jgi:hypothetical protein
MKSKLKFLAFIATLLATSIVSSLAQFPGAAAGATINPATGLPIPQIAGVPGAAPMAFDPTTGAPIAQAVPDWKDANWKDPDITLTNVEFENIPLSEFARYLTDKFKDQFDVLLPDNASGGIAYINGQTVQIGWQHDWRSEPVNLRLKNVTASEIFSAMNLVFENNRTPLRWELKMNGHRQIALLRVLIDPTPQVDLTAPLPGSEKQRRVYFVGNLIGDEKNGGMTMEQIIKTVTDVWAMADASGGNIKFHKDAQLLVVTGTQGQIDFMEQTLKALGQKADRGDFRRSMMQKTLKDVEQSVNEQKTNSTSHAH